MEKVLQYYFSWIASFRKQRQMGDGSSGQKNNPGLRGRVVPRGDITLQELQQ